MNPFEPFSDSLFKGEEPLLRVDIRVVQRNAKKRITTISGLPAKLDYEKVNKALKKMLNCSGSVKDDEEGNRHIQLSGDQRYQVSNFLVDQGICTKAEVFIHGA